MREKKTFLVLFGPLQWVDRESPLLGLGHKKLKSVRDCLYGSLKIQCCAVDPHLRVCKNSWKVRFK